MKIQNMKTVKPESPYVVYRLVDDEAYYYGQYKTMERALQVADDIYGGVYEVKF